MGASSTFGDLFHDLRFGLRQLAKSPVFTSVAVLTLALGIGANTAIFSVTNAILLRLLPVRDAERLVYLHTSDFPGSQDGYGDTSLTEPIYEALRTEKNVFSDLMAYAPLGFNRVAVRYGTEPGEAWVDMVSGNFFTGLGVTPLAGRLLTGEDESQHTSVAVVSYSFWENRLGRSYSVLGQPIYVKGVPLTIVGVAAKGFNGIEHNFINDVWIPLQTNPELKPWGTPPRGRHALYGSPDWWFLLELGRLAPGVTEQRAIAELNPIFQRAGLAGKSPDPKRQPLQLSLTPARGIEGMRENLSQPLSVLMGMVGLVLLIACANVAMLLVARNAARQREFSLRMALGGSRMRLFRQLLTESLLLVAGGAALGWFFSMWATRALASWAQLYLDLTPDSRVLLFTIAISLLAGLFFGLAPLRTVVRAPMATVLRTSTSNVSQDRGKLRSSRAIVALQIAICLVLLVGTGLLVRTLQNLENVNLGMKTDGLYVFGINPQQMVHSNAESNQFFRSLQERLRTLPGVQSATMMSNRMGGGVSSNTGVLVDGVSPLGDKFAPMRWDGVGSDFFRTLGIPLIEGRDFNDADSADSEKVVVVNQFFADKYLPHQNPMGHRVAFNGMGPFTIIGVCVNNKYTGVEEKERPIAYFSFTQLFGFATMTFELRTAGNPQAVLPELRAAMREFAPDLPMLQPMTQQAQFDETISNERIVARLSMFFGLLAVVLVATGLYGTLSYRVNRRTSEIGVRMALGAQRGQVLWMILRESLVVCLAGVVIGLPLAFASMRLLRTMLFGLGPNDAVSFVAALGGITVVALAASLIPARRAASVDPLVALRNE
jgi:predicted permease